MTTRANIVKFPDAKQRRMDELLDKNSEGTIGREEKLELEQLVREAEKLMIENALALIPQSAFRNPQ